MISMRYLYSSDSSWRVTSNEPDEYSIYYGQLEVFDVKVNQHKVSEVPFEVINGIPVPPLDLLIEDTECNIKAYIGEQTNDPEEIEHFFGKVNRNQQRWFLLRQVKEKIENRTIYY